jgi:hypothetical protein
VLLVTSYERKWYNVPVGEGVVVVTRMSEIEGLRETCWLGVGELVPEALGTVAVGEAVNAKGDTDGDAPTQRP